jgi:phosphatidylinositol alpha-mannosyltransferase
MMVTYDLASHGGGVKQHALHLAASLRRLGDEVIVVGPSSKRLPDEGPLLHTFGGVVNVPGNGSDNFLGIFASPVRIRRFFDQHDFDVIHVHEPLQPALTYWSVWMTRGIPHVATFHAFAEAEGRALTAARRVFGATIFPWFQRAIAVSPAAARYASAAWSRELTIIPNGVPTAIFHPPEVPRADDGIVRLLFVGRLGDPRKGAQYAIEAYRELLARGRRVTMDVIGEQGGAEAPPELPGLAYLGAVPFDELVRRYRACDVFVAPSTGQESFGIVLLEAMASGKPVVCSDIEGYRQVATTPGCRLAPPRDAPALADAIDSLISIGHAARAELGAINRAHAETFDYDRLAERVRAEYLLAMEPADRAEILAGH